jgi:8-oxo-dGTP pyrophosphatase MutT (NUDIX family)
MTKQYGAIPFVRQDDEIKVVLVQSARGYWIFPKGQYEDHLGKRGTAELEAFEEAGVKGTLHKKKAYHTKVFIKSGERVHLTLYALEVKKMCEKWPEQGRRMRKVVSLKTAEQLISSEGLLACLQHFERDFPV